LWCVPSCTIRSSSWPAGGPQGGSKRCFRLVDEARSLLVLGSSLTVYSGYRFAVRAARAGVPVAIVNQGPTRGDHLAAVKVEAPLGPTLSALARALAAPAA
jgi:NAD-dependent SIR2 family protein deacetylase